MLPLSDLPRYTQLMLHLCALLRQGQESPFMLHFCALRGQNQQLQTYVKAMQAHPMLWPSL